MNKLITRIETTVGYETYNLVIESKPEDSMSSSKGFYYIFNARILKVETKKSDNSKKTGPFEEGLYDLLKFPINKTLMSQQTK